MIREVRPKAFFRSFPHYLSFPQFFSLPPIRRSTCSSSFLFKASRCRCVSYHLRLAAPTRVLRRTPSARLPISTSKIRMRLLKAHIPIIIQNSPTAVGGSPWRTCACTYPSITALPWNPLTHHTSCLRRMRVTAARFVALPHLGSSSSMPLCANSRGPKKRSAAALLFSPSLSCRRCICALLRHVQDPVVGSTVS